MKKLDLLAAMLVLIGGLNWGLVAVAKFDLVASIFGLDFGQTNAASRIMLRPRRPRRGLRHRFPAHLGTTPPRTRGRRRRPLTQKRLEMTSKRIPIVAVLVVVLAVGGATATAVLGRRPRLRRWARRTWFRPRSRRGSSRHARRVPLASHPFFIVASGCLSPGCLPHPGPLLERVFYAESMEPQCPRCLDFAHEVEVLRQRLSASGQHVTYSPGPNPNLNVERELAR